jgi:hypothetical protein
MVRIISALAAILLSTTVFAQAAAPVIAADAPDRHIVVPGDTLWGIAGKFLKEPWRWPEVWRLNKEQIKNPHKIYPGDVIVLDRNAGTLAMARPVKLEPKVYADSERAAIPSIPPKVIDPFLSQPLVIELGALEAAPRIVGTQEGRVMLGGGDHAFVTGIKKDARNWHVYRQGAALKDPDNGDLLGYEAVYLGTAAQMQRGEPALIKIINSKLEIGRGDRLIEAERPPLVAYSPRKPETKVAARIMSVYGGVDTGGQYSVVTLNKGSKDGLQVGHVLALFRSGRVFEARTDQGEKESVTLPDQRYGLLFVFRTFDRVAYALTMEAERPLSTGDSARNP